MKTGTMLFLIAGMTLMVGPAGATTTGYATLVDYLDAGGSPTIFLDFDPQMVTTIESGASFSADVTFSSPENDDPTLVFHVGGGIDDNGCVGGILPGTGTFNGKLAIAFDMGQGSVAADIRSGGTPVTVEVFGTDSALLLTFSTAPDFFGVVSDVPIGSIVLAPGTFEGGGPDATCIDNLRYGSVIVQANSASWGSVKSIYR